ncbi:hypothetical protein FP026_08420 [Rhizobium tropici]|uniref:DUF4145 domain-containing protein n=1 Tax=Rhizobium tropici TaxID=398 RepID=A0A5B0W7J3_RHITR|nr:DUF4145 domain-containing protein [Rhizobium tropici]KAA1182101.1 hypothetical protein FP026_08420 [Rhizobium tropici]
MTSDSEIGKTLKAYCSECRGDRNCEIRGHYAERGDDYVYQWHCDWYLLTCRGCDHVFAQSVSTNSEDIDYDYDANGNLIGTHSETIRSWPAKSKRDRPEWFSQGVVETDLKDTVALNASLAELYGALDHDLKVLASIGMRTSFDIAAEILGIEPNKRFEQKVEELVQKGLIKESEKDHIDILVDAGSASRLATESERLGRANGYSGGFYLQ